MSDTEKFIRVNRVECGKKQRQTQNPIVLAYDAGIRNGIPDGKAARKP